MDELKQALVVWLTKEKPPKQTAEFVASMVSSISLAIIVFVMSGYLLFFTVCR